MAYDDILTWSNKLDAGWAKDALRRLAKTPSYKPSEADCAEVLARVKHANGMVLEPAPVCVALSATDLPKDVAATERTLLCSIGPVQNVDRLAKDQTLSFAINGITLIYGDNGSGKSGYSRITKKLCRSLTVDSLRGNVFEEASKKPAEVLVRYKTDKETKTTDESWVDGNLPPKAIANVSVFDSKNARLYVDKDNEIQYLPPAIEMMEHYSSLLQNLAEQIEAEINEVKRRTVIPLPTGFTEGSTVSGLIEALNTVPPSGRKGPPKAIPVKPFPTEDALIAAAAWGEDLAAELKKLEDALRDDPVAQADKHQRVAAALTSFAAELKIIDVTLSEDKAKALEAAQKKAETTKAAALAAASEIFKDEPLSHTGSEAWKLMYKYAKEYAQLAAGKPVEKPAVDGVCAACQQDLSSEALERLTKFEDFVAAKANTEAETAAAELLAAVTELKNLKISSKAQAIQQLAEFGTLNDVRKAFADKVVTFIETYSKRREYLLTAAANGDFSKLGSIPENVTAALDLEAVALKSEEESLRKKAQEDGARTEERNRLADLNDQKKLSETIATFTARLDDLQQLKKLKDCKDALSIASVSPFITKLRKNLVTDDLQERIKSEITNFDLNHIPFSVKDRSEDGKSVVGVKLKAVNEVANKDVLSEGEQRALALACFLGEVLGDPVKHGVIIDDPVSSLDHIRVRKVAERLVKEAAEGRQVVIFTHNVLFYSEVVYAAGQQSPQVPIKRHCIRKDESQGFGIIHEDDEPWIAKDVGKRIEILRSDRLSVLKGRTDTDTDEYRRAVKDFYTDLRETWERFVEEILLGGVVERFNAEVKTQSLKRVIVENDDYQKIFYAMKRVSERSGHDTAAGRTIPTPGHDEMKKDLDELDSFRQAVKKRGSDLEKERKKLEEPPIAKVA